MDKVKKQVTYATDYDTYDDTIDHAFNANGMYTGSANFQDRAELVFDFETGTFNSRIVTIPPGIVRLFEELINNGTDNIGKSRKLDVDPGNIEVVMDKQIMTVITGGAPIPIELDKKHKDIYVPEVIFGKVYSSSVYGKDKYGVAVNGLGVKLVNIFSNWFEIEVGNDFNELLYKQRWESKTEDTPGMRVRHEPIIEKYNGPPYVKVTFKLNFKRFGLTEWPDEAFQLFYRYCVDASLCSMVEVIFNGNVINYTSMVDYAKMIYGEELPEYIIHYEWPEGTEVVRKKDGTEVAKDGKTVPTSRAMILDTPYESYNVSYVNGQLTSNGGDHVTALIKAVSGPLLDSLNDKGSSKDAKTTKLTIKEIRPHLSIILLFHVKNPDWAGGQTKTMYRHDKNSGPIKFNIDEKKLNKMLNWSTTDALLATMENRQLAKLSKSDGKKRAHIPPFKGQDANWAGTKNSGECYLLVVEGGSASKFADTFICANKARNSMGVFQLKGKLLNVMKASKKKLYENPELKSLKEVLGLREGMDYSTDDAMNTLRYGAGVVFLTDADTDGNHIKALGINYFHCRFPSLLERGYITWLSTPILRVIKKGRKDLKFYTMGQYEQWKEENPNYGGVVSYYKGLSSNNPSDIKEEALDPKYVECVYDEDAPANMVLAFSNKMANKRKEWITNYVEKDFVEMPTEMEVSEFINTDLVEYSIYNIKRSIPCWDGLKPSQRKILWASLLRWKWTDGKLGKPKDYKKLKVGQFSGYVSDVTDYHHGEHSLQEAIIGMAQGFIGTNNLPYFVPDGLFGNRIGGPKDHGAERYIFVKPQWWLPYVYRKEDMHILTHEKSDQGEDIEPSFFLPIIPMILVNGADGIATGWSTYIPPHNVIDIITWYKNRILNEKTSPIEPWFRHFKGKVKIYDRNKTGKKGYYDTSEDESFDDFEDLEKGVIDNEVSDEVDDEVDDEAKEEESEPKSKKSKRPSYGIMTIGNYKMLNNKTVLITELPIRVWTKNYDDWLTSILVSSRLKNKDKKLEKFFTSKERNEEDENEVSIKLTGVDRPTTKLLRLKRTFALTNMVIVDEKGIPSKYETVRHILEMFYKKRLPYYEIRRLKLIDITTDEIKSLSEKVAFILAIKEKRLKVRNVPKSVIKERMIELGLNVKLYGQTSLDGINKDSIDKLLKQKEEKEKYLHWLTTDVKPGDLWLRDLIEFEDEYYNHYDE